MNKTLLFNFLIFTLISFNVKSQAAYNNQDIDPYISQKPVTDNHDFYLCWISLF